jgi:hypothetical protein
MLETSSKLFDPASRICVKAKKLLSCKWHGVLGAIWIQNFFTSSIGTGFIDALYRAYFLTFYNLTLRLQDFFIWFVRLLALRPLLMKMIVEKQMECRLSSETEVLGENLTQRHFCPSQNPTWPDPVLNPGRRGGKPATNRLSYDAATPIEILPHFFLSSGKKQQTFP